MKVIKLDDGFQFISKLIWFDYSKQFGWWVRFNFYPFNTRGIKCKNLKHRNMNFSERYGYTKTFVMFNWCFSLAKKIN